MISSIVTSAIAPASANAEISSNVEIVVHVDESLDDYGRNHLRLAILKDDGMLSVEFSPIRNHLLLVNYDRRKLNSRDVLLKVVAQNCSAQIIGPI